MATQIGLRLVCRESRLRQPTLLAQTPADAELVRHLVKQRLKLGTILEQPIGHRFRPPL